MLNTRDQGLSPVGLLYFFFFAHELTTLPMLTRWVLLENS